MERRSPSSRTSLFPLWGPLKMHIRCLLGIRCNIFEWWRTLAKKFLKEGIVVSISLIRSILKVPLALKYKEGNFTILSRMHCLYSTSNTSRNGGFTGKYYALYMDALNKAHASAYLTHRPPVIYFVCPAHDVLFWIVLPRQEKTSTKAVGPGAA